MKIMMASTGRLSRYLTGHGQQSLRSIETVYSPIYI